MCREGEWEGGFLEQLLRWGHQVGARTLAKWTTGLLINKSDLDVQTPVSPPGASVSHVNRNRQDGLWACVSLANELGRTFLGYSLVGAGRGGCGCRSVRASAPTTQAGDGVVILKEL